MVMKLSTPSLRSHLSQMPTFDAKKEANFPSLIPRNPNLSEISFLFTMIMTEEEPLQKGIQKLIDNSLASIPVTPVAQDLNKNA